MIHLCMVIRASLFLASLFLLGLRIYIRNDIVFTHRQNMIHCS